MLAVVTLIWLLTHISFVFKPVTTLFSLVFLPFIIAGFLYYVFNPLTLYSKFKLKRIWGIVLVFILIIGDLRYTVMALVPSIITQLSDLIKGIRKYLPSTAKMVGEIIRESCF